MNEKNTNNQLHEEVNDSSNKIKNFKRNKPKKRKNKKALNFDWLPGVDVQSNKQGIENNNEWLNEIRQKVHENMENLANKTDKIQVEQNIDYLELLRSKVNENIKNLENETDKTQVEQNIDYLELIRSKVNENMERFASSTSKNMGQKIKEVNNQLQSQPQKSKNKKPK